MTGTSWLTDRPLPILGALLDLSVSLVAVALCSVVVIGLTLASVITLTWLSRSASREAQAAKEIEVEQAGFLYLCAYVLKGYAFALFLGLTFHPLGALASATFAAAALTLYGRHAAAATFVRPVTGGPTIFPPSDLLDAALFGVLLPCLCAPVLVLHGIGAAWLVFLTVAFLWADTAGRGPTQLASRLASLCSVYAIAWATGLFLPLRDFHMVDALQQASVICVLLLTPRRIGVSLAIAALAFSPPAEQLWLRMRASLRIP
jgi:hypothetical protein